MKLKNYTILAMMLLVASAIFGQGTSHVIYGTLEYQDTSIPDPSCIYFRAYVEGGSDTLIYQPGMGSATTCTLTVDGTWMVQLSSISYINGDVLRVEFDDICDSCDEYYTDVAGAINTGLPAQDFGLVQLEVCFGMVEESIKPIAKGLSVYPNPFNGKVAIQLPDGDFDVEIFDIIGNVVGSPRIQGSTAIWAPEDSDRHVASGVYFIRATDARTGEAGIEKVIYQK